jgi:cell division protein FtsA
MKEASQARGKSGVVGLLDVGSFKIACLIVLVGEKAPFNADLGVAGRVVGVGHQRSRGIKAGVITDLDAAETAVRAAIAQAERMAGVTLDEIIVAVSGGRLKSQNFVATSDVEGGTVTSEDIERVVEGGRNYAEREGRTLLYLGRLGYRLDGVSGTRDPRGMAAKRLGTDLHAVTMDDGPIRNLLLLIERCYLKAGGVIPAGLAAGLGATTAEERRIGVTCVDIGGGSTTISVFAEGHFLYTSTLPVGGSHITYDIARHLKTPLAEAERIKALYGTLVGAQSDEHEFISYPPAGESDGDMHQMTKASLTSIIKPRFEGLLASVRERMEEGGVLAFAGENIVLTGGASQLIGATEFAARQLGLPVRIGKPQPLSGLPPALSGPAFSCLAGLLPAGVISGAESGATRERDHLARGYLGRVGQWLREGL